MKKANNIKRKLNKEGITISDVPTTKTRMLREKRMATDRLHY